MERVPTDILSREYSKRINNIALKLLLFTGYLRFEIKDGYFVKKRQSTIIRSIFMVLVGNVCGVHILFVSAYQDNYLTVTEIITVVYLVILQNCTLINIAIPNRNSGLMIIKTCIKIDVILGIKETKLMRDIAAATFVILSVFIAFFQIAIIIFLYNAYTVSAAIHVTGSIIFGMIFLIFFDACFLVAFFTFLSLRVHYMNIALTKLAKVNSEYFANQFFFNGILWRKKFDKSVTFHQRAQTAQFIKVFGFIFKQLRQLEKCFRFTILAALTSLIIGTFIGVQTIIIHKELPTVNILRTACMVAWVLLGWMYLLSIAQHIDIFYRQIEKTKLICNYIQLKPVMSANVLKLTKDMLRMLEIHGPRVSLYGVRHYNSGALLQAAAAVCVYVTVQLQLAAPAAPPARELFLNTTDNSQINLSLLYNSKTVG